MIIKQDIEGLEDGLREERREAESRTKDFFGDLKKAPESLFL